MVEKWATLVAAAFITATSAAAEKRGGLVLQFDDGWTSWATVVAPEIQKVGGVATGFVNNQNIRSGRITKEDLLTLQNTYRWEIGSHTWHHLNAPAAVQKNGMAQWIAKELTPSLAELRDMGLNVRSLAFPFNAFSRDLSKAVQPLVESYRRAESLAIADGISPDKSVPGTAIDMAHYVPPDVFKKWIDLTVRRGSLLFLYGHRVLPDSAFATGTVSAVTATTLTAELPVTLPEGDALVLVPDITRRGGRLDYFRVQKVDGKTIVVDRANLAENTTPGAQFMIGEAYSTRLSDFRILLEYAAERMNFYTLHDVATRKR